MTPNPDYNAFNRSVIAEFRQKGGAVTGAFAGAPLLLLTTTGAKTGTARTTPLVHTRDGNNIVVIASKGGAPRDPDWFRNLSANPRVTIELPGDTFQAQARVAEGQERERLYRAQAELMPNFDEYADKTDRLIPVVVLERVG
ncbi:MAG TPA: nitroreductase/quinone reductase family protein [Acidimicrobiales bacterium]|nr:nitroreductase/quinone reductase family protein [Acidimicrobiales bacterium]